MSAGAVSAFALAGVLASVDVDVDIDVQGSSACPPPAAVRERLSQLIPDGDGSSRSGSARLESGPDGLHVRVNGADGALVGERTLPGDHGCQELADAAAVMIASWLGRSSIRGLAAPPLPEPAPTVEVAARGNPRWDLGAGLGAAWSEAGLTPSAQASAALRLGRSAIGLRIQTIVTGWSETPFDGLDDLGARWRRSSLAFGPRLAVGGDWVAGELYVGAVASWLQIEGRGFPADQTRRSGSLVLGGTAGARLLVGRWSWQPFLDAAMGFWPGRRYIYTLPDDRSAALPRSQLLGSLGLRHGW